MDPEIRNLQTSPDLSQEHEWPEDMGRGLRQWAIICLTLGLLGGAAGCHTSATTSDKEAREGWKSSLGVDYPIRTMQIRENMWVIPSGRCYADSLDTFLERHPDLKIVNSEIGGQQIHGRAWYHIVFTAPKDQP